MKMKLSLLISRRTQPAHGAALDGVQDVEVRLVLDQDSSHLLFLQRCCWNAIRVATENSLFSLPLVHPVCVNKKSYA